GHLLTITWMLGNDGKHPFIPAQPLFCQKSALDGLVGQAPTQRFLYWNALNQIRRFCLGSRYIDCHGHPLSIHRPLDESQADRGRYCLRAALDLKFAINVLHLALDRYLAPELREADILVV